MIISYNTVKNHRYWSVRSNGKVIQKCLYIDTIEGYAHCLMFDDNDRLVHTNLDGEYDYSNDNCCASFDLFTFEIYYKDVLIYSTGNILIPFLALPLV
jgi:hypothetical protein